MKAIILALVGAAVILSPQTDARSLVTKVTSALQDGLNALSTKRGEWFNNYSTMNNLTKKSETQLRELAMVSKLAVPLMWHMYTMTVKKQKKYYEKVLNEGPQSLPFREHVTSLPLGANLYLETTLLLHQQRDFQMQIHDGKRDIFLFTFKFDERRAVMSHSGQQGITEEVVLAGEHFPAITLNQPFKINIQIETDCIVASIWLNNLNLATPGPLPEKHIWCTRDYYHVAEYTIKINHIDGPLTQSSEEDNNQHEVSQEEQQESVSQEDYEQQEQEEYSHEEEASGLELVSSVAYAGFILQ